MRSFIGGLGRGESGHPVHNLQYRVEMRKWVVLNLKAK